MKVEDVRAGIAELNYKEINEEYVIPDSVINSKIDEAVIFMEDITVSIPNKVKEILTKYLAQHFLLMNLKETTSLSLPNNNESWKARLNNLALDQTIPGQNFRALIRKYTDDFATAEEIANKKHHGLKFFS
jgi:hypothetical protein|nr:MAG TPA: hypothetical protein [Caudoviricetes sp.]DAT04585.1 MAG TPA: hypothetical protein [Caudoviricetes sp.]